MSFSVKTDKTENLGDDSKKQKQAARFIKMYVMNERKSHFNCVNSGNKIVK